jgi:hypothetical protein
MTTLDEIEHAVSTLPKEQKYELFQFLARQLDAIAAQGPGANFTQRSRHRSNSPWRFSGFKGSV